jgi:hypothetical protein
MFRVHESWREEAGWLLIMGGFAGFEYGVINILANLGYPDSRMITLLIMVASAAAFFLGLSLHITRPSKRQAKPAAASAPPPAPTGDAPVPHA